VVLHSLDTLIIEESIDLQLDEIRLEFERRNAKGTVVLDEIFTIYSILVEDSTTRLLYKCAKYSTLLFRQKYFFFGLVI
jgi:hypothetical protein